MVSQCVKLSKVSAAPKGRGGGALKKLDMSLDLASLITVFTLKPFDLEESMFLEKAWACFPAVTTEELKT